MINLSSAFLHATLLSVAEKFPNMHVFLLCFDLLNQWMSEKTTVVSFLERRESAICEPVFGHT
jgi:hypothetical protein